MRNKFGQKSNQIFHFRKHRNIKRDIKQPMKIIPPSTEKTVITIFLVLFPLRTEPVFVFP